MTHLRLDLDRVALKLRRTRIVATVGPASLQPGVLAKLAEHVDVYRLNFSHGSHDQHGAAIAAIRSAAAEAHREIAILADLCGPKIRVGRFEGGGIELESGAQQTVTVRPELGRPGLIPSEYKGLIGDARVGARILLDDGKLEMRILAVAADELTCEVVHGGRLTDRKGMNLPDLQVSAPAVTEKDIADARFAVRAGVDWLALSFVRDGDDVRGLRQLLAAEGFQVPIVAKIERPEALTHIGDILAAADALMVARGDLGVEVPAEEVPLIQQELIRLGIAANTPVIVATQMLESMITHPRPTRAEVTDVSAAARAGADAVMLSGETASGQYPVAAVQTMDRVLRMVEGHQWRYNQFGRLVGDGPAILDVSRPDDVLSEALSRAVAQLSRDLKVRAIVVPTDTGRTAQMVSAERPAAPILALCAEPNLARRLKLHWGVLPEVVGPIGDRASVPAVAVAHATRMGYAGPGDYLLLVWNPTAAGRLLAPTVTILRA
ncbi:MAG: pyruvate kinase [Deltaproteobacteria bacterium]|nr:pyruvate kinase [Deltaproteobacteria bacterium]